MFLKRFVEGQLLVAMGKDGNNQLFPIAWAIVQKETSETWTWFIDLLKYDLAIVDGLEWALVNDM